MMQNVVAEDRPEVGLSVVVLRTADNKAEILRVLAPLGVLLPNGLGLNVDGKDIGRAYFVRCFQDGCYAEVILEKQLLDTLKAGGSATFIVFQTPEEAAVAAREAGVDIVGASSLAAGHLTLVPELKRALGNEGAAATQIIVGGVIPPQDFDSLRTAGAAAIFPPGTVIADSALAMLDVLDGGGADVAAE